MRVLINKRYFRRYVRNGNDRLQSQTTRRNNSRGVLRAAMRIQNMQQHIVLLLLLPLLVLLPVLLLLLLPLPLLPEGNFRSCY